MKDLTTWWKGLALWVRWAIFATPLLLSLPLLNYFGNDALWLTIPGAILVIVHVFMTWDDIGDVLRARIYKYF